MSHGESRSATGGGPGGCAEKGLCPGSAEGELGSAISACVGPRRKWGGVVPVPSVPGADSPSSPLAVVIAPSLPHFPTSVRTGLCLLFGPRAQGAESMLDWVQVTLRWGQGLRRPGGWKCQVIQLSSFGSPPCTPSGGLRVPRAATRKPPAEGTASYKARELTSVWMGQAGRPPGWAVWACPHPRPRLGSCLAQTSACGALEVLRRGRLVGCSVSTPVPALRRNTPTVVWICNVDEKGATY